MVCMGLYIYARESAVERDESDMYIYVYIYLTSIISIYLYMIYIGGVFGGLYILGGGGCVGGGGWWWGVRDI